MTCQFVAFCGGMESFRVPQELPARRGTSRAIGIFRR